ncbi:MAG: AI-2E family transporter [Rhodocyclaceae bacterium]|nr:AI-2E family transporter [Rhodocyclaceae bacterium]
MAAIKTPEVGAVQGTHSPAMPELLAPPPATPLLAVAGSVSLTILAAIAIVFALKWMQSFLVPLLLGILFAYTLNRLVVWLELLRIPRALGTSIVMLGVVCTLILGTYALRGQVQTILDQLPEAVSKLSVGLARLRQGQDSTMQKMQTAAHEIERATNQATGSAAPLTRAVTRVVIDPPGFKLGNFLWANSMGAAALVGQITMVLVLTFFLLLSGDTYKRKLVRITGPTLSDKKITVHILDDINDSIQRYMFMLLATNVLVGLLTWVALRWIGLENAGAWAVAAGLLHVIPYFGPSLTTAAIGVAAFMQFDDLSTALLVAGASLAIATAVGSFVTTWMTGRIAKMNTAAVFVSLLFWAWLWGVWGMLLSIPITVIVKVVAQHVEQFEPVAELLGE